MTGPAHEKRLHPRKRCRTRVVFEDEFGEGLFYVYSRDISLGGLFLESDIPVKVGTMLFLSFALPGKVRLMETTGEVVRASAGGAAGVGIRFVGLPEKSRLAIQKFLG
ncbi:MAG: PilZ domain-containing protein [Proteobacteria bacterium]|nr:PilZ domain-containing protein [Pseudomonadota bacterium]